MTSISPNKILVIGATGRVGAGVLKALDTFDGTTRPNVRVFVRRPEALPPTSLALDIVKGDLTNLLALEAAMADVETVFMVTSDGPDQVELETNVINTALKTGVKRIVKLSAITAGHPDRPSFGAFHGAIEDSLRASGLGYSILRPSMFFQSLELFADPVRSAKRLIVPSGKGAVAMVDMNDVAQIVAHVLCTDGHNGKTYNLTGNQAYTMAHVALEISSATGSVVSHVSPPLWFARLMMRFAGGMQWWLSGQVVALFKAIQFGAEADVFTDGSILLNRQPVDLKSYIQSRLDFWSFDPKVTR